MAGTYQETKVHEKEDAYGNVTVDTTTITKSIRKREEPDYVKIYTRMWCEFNSVPDKYRRLFLALILRMSYANLPKSLDGNPNSVADKGGQVVYVIGPARKEIADECGWQKDDALCKGLQALVKCGAIRKISRGVYQINPQYAGRGKWRYDAKENQGGIENLIATFNFKAKSVDTSLIWASANPNEIGRDKDQVVATHTDIRADDQTDDQTDGDGEGDNVPF